MAPQKAHTPKNLASPSPSLAPQAYPLNPSRVRAVVFDLGGVFLENVIENLRGFGPDIGLSPAVWDSILDTLFFSPSPWDEVERGTLSLKRFGTMLQAATQTHGVELPDHLATRFMGHPGESASMPLRQEIVAACTRLRDSLKTALLTNNVKEWQAGWSNRLDLEQLFDVVIDSSAVGTRKPEAAIYAMTEEALGLKGDALLFVDDLGTNLKAAHQRGWQTLKYDDTARVLAALKTVEEAQD